MMVRELPRLAWDRPVVYRKLTSKLAGLVMVGAPLAAGGMLVLFLTKAAIVGITLVLVGAGIAVIPVGVMGLYLFVQELRRAEAEEARKKASAGKAAAPRYEPGRQYWRRR